jgi:hypothetical protein
VKNREDKGQKMQDATRGAGCPQCGDTGVVFGGSIMVDCNCEQYKLIPKKCEKPVDVKSE